MNIVYLTFFKLLLSHVKMEIMLMNIVYLTFFKLLLSLVKVEIMLKKFYKTVLCLSLFKYDNTSRATNNFLRRIGYNVRKK